MANIRTKTLRCAVCGQSSSQQVVLSRYVPDMGLDQKPKTAVLSFVLECPHCHYAADDLEAPASEQTRAYVRSAEYQEWALRQQDAGLRRLEGAAKIAEHERKWAEALRRWLTAAWYCEENDLPAQARENRERAVQMVEAVPDLRLTPAQMLTYIDSLRQLRRFARAEQAAARNEAGFVQALGAEHLLTRILRAELALAQKADAAPHLVSEVR